MGKGGREVRGACRVRGQQPQRKLQLRATLSCNCGCSCRTDRRCNTQLATASDLVCSTRPVEELCIQQPKQDSVCVVSSRIFSVLTHLFGMSCSTSPTRTKPASLLPMTMVPMSFHLSTMGMRKGASGLRSRGSMSSSTWRGMEGRERECIKGLCFRWRVGGEGKENSRLRSRRSVSSSTWGAGPQMSAPCFISHHPQVHC